MTAATSPCRRARRRPASLGRAPRAAGCASRAAPRAARRPRARARGTRRGRRPRRGRGPARRLADQLAEGRLLVPGALRALLDDPVGLVARHPRLDQRGQRALAVQRAVGQLEVRAHAVGVHRHPRRDPRRRGAACSRAGSSRRGAGPARRPSARCRARATARRSRPRPARSRAARAPGRVIRSERIGLRLWGIAEEPF